MDILIVIGIIIAVFSSLTSKNAKKAAENAKREAERQTNLPNMVSPERQGQMDSDEGKWFDNEFSGEGYGMPPQVLVNEQKPNKPPKPKPASKAHVNVTAATRHNAPQATVKSSLKPISALEDDAHASSIEVAGIDLSFSEDNVLRAVLYSEILAKPRALR